MFECVGSLNNGFGSGSFPMWNGEINMRNGVGKPTFAYFSSPDTLSWEMCMNPILLLS